MEIIVLQATNTKTISASNKYVYSNRCIDISYINQPLSELKSKIYTEQSGSLKNVCLTGVGKSKIQKLF